MYKSFVQITQSHNIITTDIIVVREMYITVLHSEELYMYL